MQSLASPCCSGRFAPAQVRLPARSHRFRVRAEVTAPAPAQKIRIKLKSYYPELLGESVEQIQEAASSTGASVSGPVPLPNRRRIYTVLRSPHVNKDSREQFQIITHARVLDVKNLSAQTIDRLMQLDLPAGVDVEVKL